LSVIPYFLPRILDPIIRDSTTRIRNIKKMTFAIEAAPAAIPVNPKIAATIAITRKITVHLSIMIFY